MSYLPLFSSCMTLCLLLSPLNATIVSQTMENQVNFISPTERLLMEVPIEKIEKRITSWKLDDEFKAVVQQVISEEKEGFFGYSGGSREFRIYQDIIRFGIEEILNISIRPDFHFLRIPGDPFQNFNSAANFLDKLPYGLLDHPSDFLQPLPMTVAIYENYQDKWESSLSFFVGSWDGPAQNFEDKLNLFFIKLGIDPVHIHQAFELARTLLTQKGGFLIQFFDDQNYELADAQTYLSLAGGRKYLPAQPLSEILYDQSRYRFPQIRLIMNNKYTLNPYSSFIMKRYDMNTSKHIQKYEKVMRDFFKTLPVDVYQKEIYKNELLSLWNSV